MKIKLVSACNTVITEPGTEYASNKCWAIIFSANLQHTLVITLQPITHETTSHEHTA